MGNWNAAEIINAISRETLQRKCILLVDNTYWTGYEADVLGITNDRRLIDVEVKISRADLKADASKDKWWHRTFLGLADQKPGPVPGSTIREAIYENKAREWPPKIWKHYYALPADIWKPELLATLPSPKSGVLLLSRGRDNPAFVYVRCERRCTPNKDAGRISEADCLDIARLANLRMWEAYAARDRAVKENGELLAQIPEAA